MISQKNVFKQKNRTNSTRQEKNIIDIQKQQKEQEQSQISHNFPKNTTPTEQQLERYLRTGKVSRVHSKHQSPNSKKFQPFKHENVEEVLHIWLKQKSQQDARINLLCLKIKATQLAQEFGVQFEPSDSWLNRFKSRHNLLKKEEEFNGPTAVQSLRTIMSKTRWELRWDSFRFYVGWSPDPLTPLL